MNNHTPALNTRGGVGRKRRAAQRLTLFLSVSLLVGLAAGCQSNAAMEAHKSQADDRWWSLRGNMILEQANQHFENEDLAQAEAALNEAARIDPDNPGVMTLAGRIAIERGELERAALTLRTAADIDPEAAEPHYLLAIIEQRWQRRQAARDRYEQAAKLDPDNPEYLLALAEAEVALGQHKAAINRLAANLDYFAQHAELHHSLGQIMLLTNQTDEAIEHLRHAASLEPDRITYQTELAIQLSKTGEHDEAITHLATLIARPELADRLDLQRALAHAYEQAGRYAEARRTYRQLARVPNPDIKDLLSLANTSYHLRDLDSAEAAAARAHEIQPNNPQALIALGLAAVHRNNHARALAWFEAATRARQAPAEAWALYGIQLDRLGRTTEARSAYEQAYILNPNDPQIRQLHNARRS
ncbi:tetratricopeptide repeat protein [Mucisphaera sp.]|uniref:tetratricopeptide repeat protein n=1 Tax=Mucisphaera sp. TaxID=2913024 RepID=UPI003D137690